MHKTLRTLMIAVALAASGPALAHSDEYLDGQPAPNGGQLRMAGPYHLELVAKPASAEVQENPVKVYVTDHAGQPVSTEGGSGRAIIVSGKLKATVTLAPAGGNSLHGIAKYGADPDMIVVVSFTPAGGQAQQARFTPGKAHSHAH